MIIFLTSAGFDNKNIRKKFIEAIDADTKRIKILFVPTAAIDDGGKAMLPVCKQEILEAGILKENIKGIEVSEFKDITNIDEYRAIYVAGGNTNYLVNEMRKYNFKEYLDDYLKNGGIYLGVSAGSIALSRTFDGCLGYINCTLNVHQSKGSHPGNINKDEYSVINLTDNQAIIIQNENVEIYE